jgi:hypothetical protein
MSALTWVDGGAAYLAGFFAAVSVAVGALALLMVTRLSGATWFVPMKRAAEAIGSTLPLFLVLFVPIALGIRGTFPWAQPTGSLDAQARASLDETRVWWNPTFFVARSYLYLVVWCGLALAWRRASRATTRRLGLADSERQRILSAVGLPVLILTASFAGFDWMMSLDAGWVSDAFGLTIAAGAFAGGVGLVSVFSYLGLRSGRLRPTEIRPAHFHALGKVLLTSVMLWAYVGVGQFIIIWMADLPREISFYADRSTRGVEWLSAAVVLGHFVIPFLLLLSRPLKRRPVGLAIVGGWVVAAHVTDVIWLTLPADGHAIHVAELAPVVVLVGSFVVAAWWRYRSTDPLPAHDPNRDASLRYEAT